LLFLSLSDLKERRLCSSRPVDCIKKEERNLYDFACFIAYTLHRRGLDDIWTYSSLILFSILNPDIRQSNTGTRKWVQAAASSTRSLNRIPSTYLALEIHVPPK